MWLDEPTQTRESPHPPLSGSKSGLASGLSWTWRIAKRHGGDGEGLACESLHVVHLRVYASRHSRIRPPTTFSRTSKHLRPCLPNGSGRRKREDIFDLPCPPSERGSVSRDRCSGMVSSHPIVESACTGRCRTASRTTHRREVHRLEGRVAIVSHKSSPLNRGRIGRQGDLSEPRQIDEVQRRPMDVIRRQAFVVFVSSGSGTVGDSWRM